MNYIALFAFLLFCTITKGQVNPVTSGLKLNLISTTGFNRTSNTNITWADQSGSGNNLIFRDGTAPSSIVKNGRVAINFNQGILENASPNNTFVNPEATVFFVTDDNIINAPVSIAENNSISNEFLIRGDNVFHHTSEFNYEYKSHQCLKFLTKDTLRVFNGRWKKGYGISNTDLFLNGVKSLDTLIKYGSQINYDSIARRIYIGGRNKFGGSSISDREYFSGNVYEILVYNRALTDVELGQVNNFLKTKYSISSTFCGINTSNVNNNLKEDKDLLFDNYPNPYSEFTNIRYYLSKKYKKPVLNIYTIDGRIVESHNLLSEVGEGNYLLNTNKLVNQVYFYNIVLDDKYIIGTNRLILIK